MEKNLFGSKLGVVKNAEKKLSTNYKSNTIFEKLFQDNKLAEYHLKRKIFEKLVNSPLCNQNKSYLEITIIKEQASAIITCNIRIVVNGERINKLFEICLKHQLDGTLKIQEFSFSNFCCNIKIEEEIYRYIAIIALNSGYSHLNITDIKYLSNNEYDFSKPNINDIFPLLAKLREISSSDIEKLKKSESENGFYEFLELVHITKFSLYNFNTCERTVSISDIISKTNQKLSDIQKNYLIKMSRKLYCGINQCVDEGYTFQKQCVVLSQIVVFLATNKLMIPETNNVILDGCMDGMGAHTVAIINGRQVDATSDQFQVDGQELNPYEDNSIYFNYVNYSASMYIPSMITDYIVLFETTFKEKAIEEFLCDEDKSLYEKSKKAKIFS